MSAVSLSHIACADRCVAIYEYPGMPKIAWDYVNDGYSHGSRHGVYYALRRLSLKRWSITFRGSVTGYDWLRDLLAIADPVDHGGLGPVHPGAFLGLSDVLKEVTSIIEPDADLDVEGHSLGAIRAPQFAGLMVLSNRPPTLLVGFEEPKPGFKKLASIIAQIPGAIYRNGSETAHEHDPITDVPVELMYERYTHSRPQTDLFTVLPGGPRPWDHILPFAPRRLDYHHMPLVAAALRRAVAGTPEVAA